MCGNKDHNEDRLLRSSRTPATGLDPNSFRADARLANRDSANLRLMCNCRRPAVTVAVHLDWLDWLTQTGCYQPLDQEPA